MREYRKNIGFDLGTSMFRFYKEGKQITEIPSSIEVKNEIYDKLLVNGRIANYNGIDSLIRPEIKKIHKPILGFLYAPFDSLISIPSDLNEVEMKAYLDVMVFSGSRSCIMLKNCFIGAVGLGLDIEKSISMIVDSGAGKTSITTIKGIDIIKSSSFDTAGLKLNEKIQDYIRKNYHLIIDLKTAEKIKKEYVDFNANHLSDNLISIKGKSKDSDKIKEIQIQSSEIINCLRNDIDYLVNKLVEHYEDLDDIYSERIKSTGIYLIGGGFKLKGLIDLISKKLNVNSKSYNLSVDYMKIGFEKVQSNPNLLNSILMK